MESPPMNPKAEAFLLTQIEGLCETQFFFTLRDSETGLLMDLDLRRLLTAKSMLIRNWNRRNILDPW